MLLNGCTQKVSLIDLETPTRDSAIFFCMIHEIVVSSIFDFKYHRIWASAWKPEEIWAYIFLWSYEFIHNISDLIVFLYLFQFSIKKSKLIGSLDFWKMKQKYFHFFRIFCFAPNDSFYWWIVGGGVGKKWNCFSSKLFLWVLLETILLIVYQRLSFPWFPFFICTWSRHKIYQRAAINFIINCNLWR